MLSLPLWPQREQYGQHTARISSLGATEPLHCHLSLRHFGKHPRGKLALGGRRPPELWLTWYHSLAPYSLALLPSPCPHSDQGRLSSKDPSRVQQGICISSEPPPRTLFYRMTGRCTMPILWAVIQTYPCFLQCTLHVAFSQVWIWSVHRENTEYC